MSRRVLVIDDKKEGKEPREENIKYYVSKGAGNLEVDVKDPDEFEDLIESEEMEEPDLVLVDWQLDGKTGDFIEGQIRSRFEEIPVYVYSSVTSKSELNLASRHRFEKVLNYSEFEEYDFLSDIKSFEKVEEYRGEGKQVIIKELLEAPKSARKEVDKALPSEFEEGIKERQEGLKSNLSFVRWVLRKLLSTPGVLYNEDWMEVKLGVERYAITEEQLEKFTSAKYTGIFSENHEDVWWWSKTRDILLDKADKTNGLTWKLGPEVLGLDDKVSECDVCGERYPQTLGEDEEGVLEQVHYSCSDVVENRGVFDELRRRKSR